jgi:hypothetical protein
MMRTNRALQLAVLTVVLCSAPAGAQVADSTLSQLRDLSGVADNRNWYLRVVTADELELEGKIRRESGNAVRVGSTTVSFESIRFVHRRRTEGGSTGSGALVGGAAGGLLGLLTASIACEISEGTCNTAMAFIGGTAGGTVLSDGQRTRLGCETALEWPPRSQAPDWANPAA